MPAVWWTALKKSLNCKSKASCDDVIKRDDDDSRGNGNGSASRRSLKKSLFPLSPSSSLLRRSGCSRTISNLRDAIRSSNQQQHHEGCASPRSIGSSDVQTHDALLVAARGSASGRDLRTPPPPGHGWSPFQHSPLLMRCSTTPLSQRKSPRALSPLRREGFAAAGDDAGDRSPAPARASFEIGLRCRRCGGRVANEDALEWHHLANHAVSEVAEDDSARGVVEIICMAGWPKPEAALDRVERIVKIHSLERRVARYEEFRSAVMARAAQLQKKHPRCIADGNELLHFHATTVSCSLGAGGLCTSGRCDVCRIIRHGFSVVTTTREDGGGGGVFTTSTSRRALECVVQDEGEEEDAGKGSVKRALLVCRVIAGRIHRPMENLQDVAAAQTGFDSFAGKVGADSTVEELYLLNPRALLPCYVVIYKS
ncbi:hypothetical protein PR202_gb28242 [Eleusine coracana subsp. coracana]|uniref:C2H2-type domain-containing protein n=1 Tax=Eleusine coracana subsp. coracana TaxID=191504 RepID=A0AAV5FWJ3_ELECO|nr:hypothetical protein QOZ80_6AG0548420 [Eleusine coracana subsp. coracana]GJN39143.1 hypothetical protein PR202_gb28242 [Eleusine coracana subsp. coracana]